MGYIYVLLVLLSLSAVPVSSSVNASLRVDVYLMCHDVNPEGNPILPTRVFLVTDEKAVLWIRFAEIYSDTNLRTEWISPSGKIMEEHLSVASAGENQIHTFSMSISEDPKIPMGTWLVRLYTNEVLLVSYSFSITQLRILASKSTANPNVPAYPNNEVQMTWRIQNVASMTANSTSVTLENATDGLTILKPSETKDIGRGSIEEFTITIRYDKPGQHSGTLVTRASGIIQLQEPISVKVDVPAIRVLGRRTTPEEGEAIYPGNTVTIVYVVKNEGSGPVKGCKVELALIEGIEQVESGPSKDINPGENLEVYLKFKALQEGDYELKARFLLGMYEVGGMPFPLHVSKAPPIFLLGSIAFAVVLVIGALVYVKMRDRKTVSSSENMARPINTTEHSSQLVGICIPTSPMPH